MPEGDTVHRAARALQPLVGRRVAVETPHPQARSAIDAALLDGRVLESVTALGKNLVLRFEGGIVLRSHLRLSGRWQVRPVGGRPEMRRPWLVLRAADIEAALWNGPALELHTRALARLGPDILAAPPDLEGMLVRMRQADGSRWFGEALLDQSVVAGIGNMWLAESLWEAELSPWRRLRDVPDAERRLALETAAVEMRAAVDGARPRRRRAYRRAGLPCARCGTLLRSRGQGDANRIAYWCPRCQVGDEPPVAN